jgi:hypothetical protein
MASIGTLRTFGAPAPLTLGVRLFVASAFAHLDLSNAMITPPLSHVLFWLFIGMGALSWYFFMRFLAEVRKTGVLSDKELEALSSLLISGSGGAKSQWSALAFILERGYAEINDTRTIEAGDRARTSWFLTFGLLVCTGLSLVILGW